jgi:hypothetical protein
MPGSLAALWPQALEALNDVDYILHAGDLHTLDIVDELSKLAPTYVSIGNGDVGIVDDRLQDNWMFEFEGVRVGLIHHFPSPARKSPEKIKKYVARHFERTPDVVIFGHTHFEGVYQVDQLLCVNPGSPTLPRNQSARMGTLGYLDINDGCVAASIHQITGSGIIPHETLEPVHVASLSR